MTDGRRGDWLQTYTGLRFYPLDPRPDEVNIKDIAHALSLMCRFTGHCRVFYSVAQHSDLVSQRVSPAHALPALLHDAAEAYVGDIGSPLKRHLRAGPSAADTRPFYKMEHDLLMVIGRRFGLSGSDWFAACEELERADRVLLATEARDLMGPLDGGRGWKSLEGVTPLAGTITPVLPETAEAMFMERYYQLRFSREE